MRDIMHVRSATCRLEFLLLLSPVALVLASWGLTKLAHNNPCEADELALVAGGLLLIGSLALIAWVVRGAWRGSLGFWHALMLVAYHGVCEVNYAIFSEGLSYRNMSGFDWSRQGLTVLVAGLGVLAFAVGYLLGRPRPVAPRDPLGEVPGEWLLRLNPLVLFPWLVCIIVWRVGASNLLLDPASSYVVGALLFYVQVPVVTVVLLRLSFQHARGRLFTPSYVAGIVVITVCFVVLGNNRQETLYTLGATFALLHKWDIKFVSTRRLLVAAVLLLVMFLGLAVIRGAVGRDRLAETSPMERLQIVLGGIEDILAGDILAGSPGTEDDAINVVTTDIGYRLDCNAFLGNILDHDPWDPLRPWDLAAATYYMEEIIPSFLWSSKTSRTYLNCEEYMIGSRGIADVDYLGTPLACFFSIGGITLMALGQFFTGYGAAVVERRWATAPGLPAGIATISATVALFWVEQGINVWMMMIRNAIIILILLGVANWLANWLTSTRPFGQQAPWQGKRI